MALESPSTLLVNIGSSAKIGIEVASSSRQSDHALSLNDGPLAFNANQWRD